LLSKGPPTGTVICKYYSLKGAQTATLLCKYYTFKGVPLPSPMCKQRKASNQLLYLKNCGLKFLPKSSEKTLSNKSKHLYQMIILHQMMIVRDWSVRYIDNFMKMPHLNRKYPSGAAEE